MQYGEQTRRLLSFGAQRSRALFLFAVLFSATSVPPALAGDGNSDPPRADTPPDCSSITAAAEDAHGAADCPGPTREEAEAFQRDQREEASIAIAENAQGTFLLRKLLGERRLHWFGRIEGEGAMYDLPALEGENGVEIRRFRVGMVGWSPLFDRISWKVEVDLTDQAATVSDVYLNFDFGGKGALVVGNQDGSQSLSSDTGSLSLLFMESPLMIQAFGLGKRVGVSYSWSAKRSGAVLLAFGRDLNSDARHKGLFGRAWFNPLRSHGGVWHVGGSLLREDIDDDTALSTRPESHVTDVLLVDTGTLSDVASTRRLGLELAGAIGSFTTRFEYMRNDWKRDDGSRNHFRGAYLESGYFFGGVPFRYHNGQFMRPDLAGYGVAYEMAWRYSWIDLNDGAIRGGEERNLGLAFNVYPRTGLRIQSNLILVNADQPGGNGLLLQARLQFNW
jgi:phosphate-selective porin OprO/OprP